MAQSPFVGGTDYSNQSIVDIKEDLYKWIETCEQIKEEFDSTIANLKERKYWEDKIPFDFRSFCLITIRTSMAFSNDFKMIVNAIENDAITQREISLLKNIYHVSHEYEEMSWKSFKNSQDGRWHEYGNEDFSRVETLYADGRDFFANFFDAGAMAARMKDYMKTEPIAQSIVNANDSVIVGDNNNIGDIKNKVQGKKQAGKKGFFQKYVTQIIIAAVAAVIAGIVLYFLKMN